MRRSHEPLRPESLKAARPFECSMIGTNQSVCVLSEEIDRQFVTPLDGRFPLDTGAN